MSNASMLERLSCNIFITNFPTYFSSKDLWNTWSKFGTVLDVYIPNKVSKQGKRYDFARIKKVSHVDSLISSLRDTAKHVTEVESVDIEDLDNNSVCKSVCANSMYSITQTILLSYQDTSTAELSQEVLFARLSSMISGILVACLTNLPQVIAMKCHTSSIEKREASVNAAAQLLGETTQIINNLQDRELPSLNPDELPFINKWCAYFRDQFP
nr:hypothetical protein CTI12_AA135620 [Tanacetum cinerariifolium]